MHSHQILLKGRIFSYFPSNFRDQISPSNCMGCIRHTHATNLHLKCYEKTSRSEGCNTYSCDPAKCSWLYMPFLAATKHLYECFNPSVLPSYVIVRKREKKYLTLWPFFNLWPWLVAGPGLMSCSTVTENSTAIVTMWRKMFCQTYVYPSRHKLHMPLWTKYPRNDLFRHCYRYILLHNTVDLWCNDGFIMMILSLSYDKCVTAPIITCNCNYICEFHGNPTTYDLFWRQFPYFPNSFLLWEIGLS